MVLVFIQDVIHPERLVKSLWIILEESSGNKAHIALPLLSIDWRLVESTGGSVRQYGPGVLYPAECDPQGNLAEMEYGIQNMG
jgi:hypothetical protein